MALINFDCPECGHNLEVDERGAGFIIKCPECGNPLQIPELPRSRRMWKVATAVATLAALLLLLAANLYFWTQNQKLRRQVDAEGRDFAQVIQKAQALAMDQDQKIQGLTADLAALQNQIQAENSLAAAALDAIAEAESLAKELEKTSREFLDNHAGARTALLRGHMAKVVETAKNSLPAAPVITEVEPGQGVQGRLIVFPVLPGPDGQKLRENAEVTGVEDDKVSVKFAGGTATYSLTELHPGVAAYLPVDPLLALERNKWAATVRHVHQMANARRDEHLAQLRSAIETRLPAE